LCMLRITFQHHLEITNGLVMISLCMIQPFDGSDAAPRGIDTTGVLVSARI
jgi:hypothetical protein